MSTGQRKEFYNSKVWKKVKRNVWLKQNCLCFNCGLPVYVYGISEKIPKENQRRGIIHHKEHLTELNIADDSIALDEANLIGVCLYCHNNVMHPKQTSPTREGYTFDEQGQLIKSPINDH